MSKAFFYLLQVCLYALGFSFTSSQISLAQVTSDNTINTEVTQNGSLAEITGGETSGTNLFHSFQDFSVQTGNEAFFNNANDISNIFSRVTGGNVSNIDGIISANGSANLFLINPAGIMFGENASLNIGGSFYGSSASSIVFENGEFNTDLDNPPLLTVNAPIGLGFRDNTGDIAINQSTLQVNIGETLALLGGDLNFDGGTLEAFGSRVELGGLTESGIVDIKSDGNFNYPEVVGRGNVSFANNAGVFVAGEGGGSININANNLSLTSDSRLFAGIASVLGFPDAQGGDVIIDLKNDLVIDNSSIENSNAGVGNTGNLKINTDSLFVDQGVISADVLGQGNGGTIKISATDSIELANVGLIQAETVEDSTGNSGDIIIETNQLTLNDGSQISVTTPGDGDAGNITINASESINLSGIGTSEFSPSGIVANALLQSGQGGDINLTTYQLTISDGAIITASNFSSIEAKNVNASALEEAFAPATGEPGDISITANSLSLESGGRIEAITEAENGNEAEIDLEINLQIADSIFLSGDSSISAMASGNANGGNLTIDTKFIVAFEGNNDIIASAEQGEGGNIDITAESLLGIAPGELSPFTNDINASSQFGLNGNVTLDVPDVNSLQGGSELATEIIVPKQTTAQACNSNREIAAHNGFTIKGKGGVPPSPEMPLDSTNIIVSETDDNDAASILPQPVKTSLGDIQPARGIKATEEDGIILTAYRTNNQGDRLTAIETNCGIRN